MLFPIFKDKECQRYLSSVKYSQYNHPKSRVWAENFSVHIRVTVTDHCRSLIRQRNPPNPVVKFKVIYSTQPRSSDIARRIIRKSARCAMKIPGTRAFHPHPTTGRDEQNRKAERGEGAFALSSHAFGICPSPRHYTKSKYIRPQSCASIYIPHNSKPARIHPDLRHIWYTCAP